MDSLHNDNVDVNVNAAAAADDDDWFGIRKKKRHLGLKFSRAIKD